MANKTTKKKTTAKTSGMTTQTTGKKRGRPSKKAQKQAEINRAWSILMFALGAMITAMSFVPGENFWAYLRDDCRLGMFGFSSSLVGPVLLYIGYLTAFGKPVKRKMFWAL